MKTKVLFCLLIATVVFSSVHRNAHSQTAPERPVVVIPGILGSKLCERDTGKVVWGDRWSLSNFSNLALPVKFDPSNLPHRACGLIDAVNVLGPFQVDQYEDLLKTLQGLGYTKDINLFVFDYDWRLSNRASARAFDALIAQKIPDGQFDIVAHSMGGIVAKLWMSEAGHARRVGSFITLGTPHLGAADTFKTLDQGWGFWLNLAARGLGSVRETAMTFPSFYELLPLYENCCGFRVAGATKPQYFDPFLGSNWNRFKWLPSSFSSPERQTWLTATLSDAKAVLRQPIPQGPKLVTVVNSLVPTAYRVIFDFDDGRVLTYEQQPGDGTVVQWSASNNKLSDARPALTSHKTIFSDDASRQSLRWVLVKGPMPTAGILSGLKASLRTATNVFVDIASASATLDPPVLSPGESGQFVVELTGSPELAGADLSNVHAFLDTSPPVPLASPKRSSEPGASGQILVRIMFPIIAPAEPGAFAATVHLPSISFLSDTGLVVPK